MKKLLTALLAMVVLVGLGLQSLPYLVRDQLVLWFYAQGVEDARLRTLSVNWLTGQVRIEGLALTRQGYPALTLAQLQLDLDLEALWHKRLRVTHFHVEGLQGGLVKTPQQLWLGPIPLPASDAETDTAPTSADNAASPWQVGLDRLTLRNLTWHSDWLGQQYPVEIRAADLSQLYQWAPLTETDIRLEGRLNGAPLHINTAGTPLQQSPRFSVDLQLKALPLDNLLALAQQPLRARLSSDLKLTLQLNPLQVEADGSLGLSDLQWQAQPEARVGQLQWQGRARWVGENSRADLAGTLALKDSALTLADQQTLAVATTQWSGEAQLQLTDGLAAVSEGALNIGALAFNQPGTQQARLAGLDWQGRVEMTQTEGQPLQLKTDNQLSLQGLTAQHQSLSATLEQLALNNQLTLQGQDWTVQQPEMTLQALTVQEADYALLNWQQLRLQGLQATPRQADFDTLAVTELALAQLQTDAGTRPLSRWQQVQVAQLSWNPQALRINDIQLNGGDTLIRRDEQGALLDIAQLQQRLAALQPAPASTDNATASRTDTNTDTETSTPVIQLMGLSVQQPHAIQFSDQSVSPAFRFDGEVSRLAVGPWDSEGKRPTDLNLLAKLNGDGELTLKGVLDTATMQSGGWALDISGLEMPYLSPYAMEYTGYYVDSGQLMLRSEGTLAAGQLEGKNTLRLNNFDVEPRQQDKVGKVSQQLSMPLETAVMVLEDDDQNIELDLDVSGSLDDPNFGYQSVINSLAGRGLKTAAISYLTKSLQPYATVLSLAKTALEASEKGTFITLQPVAFDVASTTLSREMQDYTGKLVTILNDRPAMRLKLCGDVVAADTAVLRKALEEENKKRKEPLAAEALAQRLTDRLQRLASQRGQVVKDALATQVDKKRLFVCYPQVDASKAGKPTVSVGI